MKPTSIQALLQANVLLPVHKRHSFGKLIYVLAFLKAWSDSCCAHASQKQGYLSPKPDAAIVAAQRLSMAAKTMYDSFLPADVARILTPDEAKSLASTVDSAIARLVLANPTLKDVFQPGHFLLLQSVYAKSKAKTAPHALVSILATINQVKFEHAAPSFACANEFAWVMPASTQNSNITARAVAPLIAQLMNPQAFDVVLDMVCGQGHLLLALADQLACTQPNATLQLIGMEKDHDQWALAKMLLSLAGLPHQGIQHHYALSRGYNGLSEAEQKLTTGGADMVVIVLPEKFTKWPSALARDNQDPRFKVHLPIDGRLALFWLGLVAMKPDGGRMAILVPMDAFCPLGGLELAKHIVDLNLLDAVIALPGIKGYVLLMLHTQRTQSPIGFIQTKPPITNYTVDGICAVRSAWQHYQTGRAHPCVVRIERTVIAANHYQFDLHAYEEQIQATQTIPKF